MQAYDLIMLIVIGMSTIFGAIKGLAWQVASLASIVVSYLVAYRYRFHVADMIEARPPWNMFLAMLLLFVGTSFVIWVIFRLMSGFIDRIRLRDFDRHLGAVFGLVKGLVFCLLITMFAMTLLGPVQQAAICQSRSGYAITKALDKGLGVLPDEVHDVVGPYLARLDGKLRKHRPEPEPQFEDPEWFEAPESSFPQRGYYQDYPQVEPQLAMPQTMGAGRSMLDSQQDYPQVPSGLRPSGGASQQAQVPGNIFPQ